MLLECVLITLFIAGFVTKVDQNLNLLSFRKKRGGGMEGTTKKFKLIDPE